MNYILSNLKNLDWILIVVAVVLSLIGLLFIYSASSDDLSNFNKQIAFLIIGVVLMFAFSFSDWRAFKDNSSLVLALYFVSLLGLVGLFFFAPEIRGVKSWYKIGEISIDPIEFSKIVLIILLAKYFSKKHIEICQIRHVFFSGLYVLFPVVLISFQPDLGSALILVSLWAGVLIVSGIRLRHFLILILIGLVVLLLGWNTLLQDYHKERIASFLSASDPLGVDWNQNQARIAIGSGGIFGQGIGSGSQTQYGFLPEVHTDFIFSAVAEEAGLVGVLFLMILFCVLLWRIFRVAMLARSNFPRLFATGFAICLISQAFIHIGMNLGLLPIIGISLPFVSYGGSGLVGNFVLLGILLSLRK